MWRAAGASVGPIESRTASPSRMSKTVSPCSVSRSEYAVTRSARWRSTGCPAAQDGEASRDGLLPRIAGHHVGKEDIGPFRVTRSESGEYGNSAPVEHPFAYAAVSFDVCFGLGPTSLGGENACAEASP